jgi:acyl-CoA reductase-like NAD-dependent aldehyde dehydrogenase
VIGVRVWRDENEAVAESGGGFKQSGWSREKAIHSLDAYTRLKSVWVALTDGER